MSLITYTTNILLFGTEQLIKDSSEEKLKFQLASITTNGHRTQAL